MGRKTWDSIPTKFRPLKGRVNVVISRNVDILEKLGKMEGQGDGASTRAVGAESIVDAVLALQKHYGDPDADVKLGRVFVIGGASIYEQAMGMECCERILWTRIRREFECDVFFPGEGISKRGAGEGGMAEKKQKMSLGSGVERRRKGRGMSKRKEKWNLKSRCGRDRGTRVGQNSKGGDRI